jgi:hypothetical protein
MQIAVYALCFLLLCAVFELGSMISQRSDEWSVAIDPEAGHYQTLRKSFFLSGKIIQAAAVLWAVMNFVALMHAIPHI